MAPRSISDPLEQRVAHALDAVGTRYHHESEGKELTNGLDFYLPDDLVHIEVKRFSTPRTAEQIKDVTNVILLQGVGAVISFCTVWKRGR